MNSKKSNLTFKKKLVDKFPNISRFITELKKVIKKNKKTLLLTNRFFILMSTFILIGLSLFLIFCLQGNLKTLEKNKKEKEGVLKEIKKWQNTVKEYKDYRDGYFMLSILEYRIKNYEKAREYLDDVFEIDPNFKQGRELELILQDKD